MLTGKVDHIKTSHDSLTLLTLTKGEMLGIIKKMQGHVYLQQKLM